MPPSCATGQGWRSSRFGRDGSGSDGESPPPLRSRGTFRPRTPGAGKPVLWRSPRAPRASPNASRIRERGSRRPAASSWTGCCASSWRGGCVAPASMSSAPSTRTVRSVRCWSASGARRRGPYCCRLPTARRRTRPSLALKEDYGAAGLRLLVLTLSNPGVLYATNPSTLGTFFEEVDTDWEAAVALVRVVVRDPGRIAPAARRILRRLASKGSAGRLARVAESATPLPITVWAPGVSTYVCWTGGAVAPFLERLDRRLPAPRFTRSRCFRCPPRPSRPFRTTASGRRPSCQPRPVSCTSSSRVGSETALLGARELQPGGTYEMVVSHGYGLRRYATGDLFRSSVSSPVFRTCASSDGAASAGPSPEKSSPPSRSASPSRRCMPNLPDCETVSGWRFFPRTRAARHFPATTWRRSAGRRASPGACPKASRNDSMNFSGSEPRIPRQAREPPPRRGPLLDPRVGRFPSARHGRRLRPR